MNNHLDARMALFEVDAMEYRYELTDRLGLDLDGFLGKQDRSAPEPPLLLSTVNWSVDPRIGFPVAPFQVSLFQRPLDGEYLGVRRSSVDLTSAAGYRVTVDELFSGHHAGPMESAICVLAKVELKKDAGVVFAVDRKGQRVHGTTLNGSAPDGTAFLGPGIHAIVSDGPALLVDVLAFGLPTRRELLNELERWSIAEVAPPVELGAYDSRYYLDRKSGAGPKELDLRLMADRIARSANGASTSEILRRRIHQADLDARKFEIFADPFVKETLDILRADSGQLTGNDGHAFTRSYADASTRISVPSASLWQLMALSGPMEAAVLGQAITAPIPDGDTFTFLHHPSELYQIAWNENAVPYPLIEVTAYHGSSAYSHFLSLKENDSRGNVLVSRALARLVFPRILPGIAAEPGDTLAPDRMDGPATTDIKVSLFWEDPTIHGFLELPEEGEPFGDLGGDNRPKPFLPLEDEGTGEAPYILRGPLELPDRKAKERAVVFHPRDLFGRWLPPKETSVLLKPWPLPKPTLAVASIEYGTDGVVRAILRVTWEWATRSLRDLEVTARVAAPGSEERGSSRQATLGAETVREPASLTVHFDRSHRPSFSEKSLPRDFSVSEVARTGNSTPRSGDIREYLIERPLGKSEELFAERHEVDVLFSASASVTLIGDAPRSRVVHARATLTDPRPPVLLGERWSLVWSSLPDAAGYSRAHLRTPDAERASGFHLWRAREESVLDFALPRLFSDEARREAIAASFRRETNARARLAMLQSLIEPLLRRTPDRRSFVNLFDVDRTDPVTRSVEITLPGSQRSLELILFSAISPAGVSSDKARLEGMSLTAVAVPRAETLSAPTLRLYHPRTDLPGAFQDLCVASISHEQPMGALDVTFYWEARDSVKHEEELMQRLLPVAELPPRQIDMYLPGLTATLRNGSSSNMRFFLLQPTNSWQSHALSATVRRSVPRSPGEEVVSPRARLAVIRLVPRTSPALSLLETIRRNQKTEWQVGYEGLFVNAVPGVGACELQVRLLRGKTPLSGSEPVRLEECTGEGLRLYYGSAGEISSQRPEEDNFSELRVRCKEDTSQIIVTLTGPSLSDGLSLTVADPKGRWDTLALRA